jgi:hypothetical protein
MQQQQSDSQPRPTFDQFFQNLVQANPIAPPASEPIDASYYTPVTPRHNVERQHQWNRQALTLSLFGVGLFILGGSLLLAYLPGDRTELARLRVEVDRQTSRANELQATVEEQNKLLQAYNQRNEELNNSLFDAQQDIKEVRKFMSDRFSEYGEAPHE